MSTVMPHPLEEAIRKNSKLEFGKKVYSLEELGAADIERPRKLVDDFLNEGEVVALVARPKTGKTRLAQQLAVALAKGAGADFVGQQVSRAGRTLYIDLESQPAELRDRFRRIAGEDWDTVRDKIKIYCLNSLADCEIGLDGEKLAFLKSIATASKPDLVIVDTWRLVLVGRENDNQDMVKNLKAISSLKAINPRVAILLIHHPKKTDVKIQISLQSDPQMWLEQASGGLSFIGHTDAAFGLEHEMKTDTYVFTGRRRSGDAPLKILRSDPETLRFGLLDDQELLARSVFSPAQLDLWQQLSGEFNWAEAESAAGGKNKKSLVSSTLKKARENAMLSQPAKGIYRKAKTDSDTVEKGGKNSLSNYGEAIYIGSNESEPKTNQEAPQFASSPPV